MLIPRPATRHFARPLIGTVGLVAVFTAPALPESPKAEILTYAAVSSADGIQGPRVGVKATSRVPVGRSSALVASGSAAHIPKLDANGGQTYTAALGLETHRWRDWIVSATAVYARLETPNYSKHAWSTKVEVGRRAGPLRLYLTGQGPDDTRNRARSARFTVEWRPKRWILRWGGGWLWQEFGHGPDFAFGFGRVLGGSTRW